MIVKEASNNITPGNLRVFPKPQNCVSGSGIPAVRDLAAKGLARNKVDSNSARKEAIRTFKEQKPQRGIFAVRCTETGLTWAGSSFNFEATKNRLWFSLRNGSYPNKELQEEWRARGETTFQFEIVETLADDVPALRVKDLLKEKRGHWMTQLGAQGL